MSLRLLLGEGGDEVLLLQAKVGMSGRSPFREVREGHMGVKSLCAGSVIYICFCSGPKFREEKKSANMNSLAKCSLNSLNICRVFRVFSLVLKGNFPQTGMRGGPRSLEEACPEEVHAYCAPYTYLQRTQAILESAYH